jgi:hypothetical protein
MTKKLTGKASSIAKKLKATKPKTMAQAIHNLDVAIEANTIEHEVATSAINEEAIDTVEELNSLDMDWSEFKDISQLQPE